MTIWREKKNVLVIEKGLFAKRFTSSAGECKRHLLAGDYSALKECPFVLGGMEDIDGRISRDILRRAGVDNPIVTAVSHNVGMLLWLSLNGVGACICPQKIVQSALTPQQMGSVWLFLLGAEKSTLKKVNKLLMDIMRNGYDCSYGKVEMLKGDFSGFTPVRYTCFYDIPLVSALSFF